MTAQEEQEILTYFNNHNLNIKNKPEYKKNKKMLLEVAEKTMRLLGDAGEQLISKTDVVSDMFEQQLQERINKQT